MTVIDSPFWRQRLYYSLKFKRWMLDRKEYIESVWKDMLHSIRMMRPAYRVAYYRQELARLKAQDLKERRSWEEMTTGSIPKIKAKLPRRVR